MSKIITVNFNTRAKIQTIKVDKFPIIIFSDSHTNIQNIRKLQNLYPDSKLICLGDITFFFAKFEDKWNETSVQFFVDNKIPVCSGNHDEMFQKYNITYAQKEYLKNLPTGFRLELPDGRHYLLFHHLPNDVWGHKYKGDLDESQFLDNYPIDENKTIDVIHGHCHENFIEEYPYITQRRICVGQLCNGNHHDSNDNAGGNYLLITEKGVEFRKINDDFH